MKKQKQKIQEISYNEVLDYGRRQPVQIFCIYGGSIQNWNQIFYKKSQIIKGGMQIEQKYKDLKERLEKINCDNFTGSMVGATYYYFKKIEELSTQILLEQNEIKQLKNKISFMNLKTSQVQTKYAQKKRKQQQKRYIHCQQQDCKQTFLKQKQLHYHKLFNHEEQNLMKETHFNFKFQQIQE